MMLFDICVITASNRAQADAFSRLLKIRIDHGLYPREIDFRVYHDPEAGRVGSGGGTLWALHQLAADFNARDIATFFRERKILIIHAGGESRRLPCYAPEGKLFAPLPLPSSSVLSPCVLDVQLSLFLKYPWRRGEVVVAAGDVLVDFDTTAIPADRGDICGFAAPATPEQGSRHGVFIFDANRKAVVDVCQKASPRYLTDHALVEGTGDVAIDLGIVALTPPAVTALLALGETRLGSGTLLESLARGACRFDLYVEILTASLAGLSYADYSKRLAGISPLPESLLRVLFDSLHRFPLHAVLGRRSLFLHFGSLKDFLPACRTLVARDIHPFYAPDHAELKAEPAPAPLVFNSTGFQSTGAGTLVAENISNCTLTTEGDNLLVGLSDLPAGLTLPAGLCLDERQRNGAVIRAVYHAADTFTVASGIAEMRFCNTPLAVWMQERGLSPADLWTDPDCRDLLQARLFCENAGLPLLEGFWKKTGDAEWTRQFRSARRWSLSELNQSEDVTAREQQRTTARAACLRDAFAREAGWQTVSFTDFLQVVRTNIPATHMVNWLSRTNDPLLRLYRRELLVASRLADIPDGDAFLIDYLGRHEPAPLSLAVKEDQIVWARSPLRLDLAGGWSDTPPYALRYGGQVVNCAVDLNGQPPVQVFCRRTTEPFVRLHSIDTGCRETCTDFETLSDYRSPASPFALPKAALCLLGFTREQSGCATLESLLKRLGSGLEITLLCAVPKGSGLGTSSILGATILAALHRFFGLSVERDDLFRRVLHMEQMLTTGGGWQDQIGGIVGGIKYNSTTPGLRPAPLVHQLNPNILTQGPSLRRFTLFYTGITRLAKNILSEVVQQVNRNTPAYLFTLRHMRQLALDVRHAIELGDVETLGPLLRLSWEANKRIHPGTTNPDVEALLARTARWTIGAKLLGAGGGGYALLLATDEAAADATRNLLRKEFENNRARIVDFTLNTTGLQVSVS